MASATATAKADPGLTGDDETPPRRAFRFGGSRLGGFILALNLLSLLILFGGALLLNELSRGLVQARQESLSVQAELLSNVLGELGITRGEPSPELDPISAARWLRDNFIPQGQRVRLYDINGLLVADSYQVTEAIPGAPLPDARPAGTPQPERDVGLETLAAQRLERANRELTAEVANALAGQSQQTLRRNEEGDRVVSVSIPVRHVSQVLGVLTLEASQCWRGASTWYEPGYIAIRAPSAELSATSCAGTAMPAISAPALESPEVISTGTSSGSCNCQWTGRYQAVLTRAARSIARLRSPSIV